MPRLRAGECVAAVFFLYLSASAWIRHLEGPPQFVPAALSAVILAGGLFESGKSAGWSRVLRDWLTMGLILAAYWSLAWFASPPIGSLQNQWVQWDRTILETWGLRPAIESVGILFPSLLETAYLLLYALPPVCLCLIYGPGGRTGVNAFLFTLLLGTLSAYALLPLIPVHGPRVAFPGLDDPNILGFCRSWNVWILDHLDIPTSVFPSGHVAVAFSAAFGTLRAVRSRPAIWGAAFLVASLVFIATIYCRYHYAVDGLASICLAAAAWKLSDRGGSDE